MFESRHEIDVVKLVAGLECPRPSTKKCKLNKLYGPSTSSDYSTHYEEEENKNEDTIEDQNKKKNENSNKKKTENSNEKKKDNTNEKKDEDDDDDDEEDKSTFF